MTKLAQAFLNVGMTGVTQKKINKIDAKIRAEKKNLESFSKLRKRKNRYKTVEEIGIVSQKLATLEPLVKRPIQEFKNGRYSRSFGINTGKGGFVNYFIISLDLNHLQNLKKGDTIIAKARITLVTYPNGDKINNLDLFPVLLPSSATAQIKISPRFLSKEKAKGWIGIPNPSKQKGYIKYRK